MSNEPGTYHLLVTLRDVTGEESDHLVSDLQTTLDDSRGPDDEPWTAEHLTPETLPDRYIERNEVVLEAARCFLHGEEFDETDKHEWAVKMQALSDAVDGGVSFEDYMDKDLLR